MGKGKGYEYYRKKDHAELFAAVMSADPDSVEVVADGWKVSSEVLAQAETDMVNALDTLMASWKGEAAEEFQRRVGTLRQYMDATQSDLRETNEQLKYLASSTRWAQEEAKAEADPGDNLDIDDFRKRFGDDVLGTGADMLRDLNGGRHNRLAEIVSKVADDFQHWVSDDAPERTPPQDMPGTPSYPDRHNVNPDDVASVGPHPVDPSRVPSDRSRLPDGSLPSKDDVRDWIDRIPGSDNINEWIDRIPEGWRDKIPWPGGGDGGSGTPPSGSDIDHDDIWGGPHPAERLPFDRDDISGGPHPADPNDRFPDSGGGGSVPPPGGGNAPTPPPGGGNIPAPAPSPEPSIPGPVPTPHPDGNGPGWNVPGSEGREDDSDLSDGLHSGTPAPPGGGAAAPPSPGPSGPGGPGGGGPNPMPGGPGGTASPPGGRASVPSPGGAGGGAGAPRPIGGGTGVSGSGAVGGGARGSAGVGGAGGPGAGSGGGTSGGRGGIGPNGIGGGAGGSNSSGAHGGRGGMGMMPMMGGSAGGASGGSSSGGGKGRGGKKKDKKEETKSSTTTQKDSTDRSSHISGSSSSQKGENKSEIPAAKSPSFAAMFDPNKKAKIQNEKSDSSATSQPASKKENPSEEEIPIIIPDDGMPSGVDLMETEFNWMEFDPEIGPDSNDPKDVLLWEMRYDMWVEEQKQADIDERWKRRNF